MPEFDIVIVGGGLCGSVAALTLQPLAARGTRVLLLDAGSATGAPATREPLTPDLLAHCWQGPALDGDRRWDAVSPTVDDVARVWPGMEAPTIVARARRLADALGRADTSPSGGQRHAHGDARDEAFAESAARAGLAVRAVPMRRGLSAAPAVRRWVGATAVSLSEQRVQVRLDTPQADGTPAGLSQVSARHVVLATGTLATVALLRTAFASKALAAPAALGRGLTVDVAATVVAEWPRAFAPTDVGGRSSVESPDAAWACVAAPMSRREAADAVPLMGPAGSVAAAVARMLALQIVAAGTAGEHAVAWRGDGSARLQFTLGRRERHALVEGQRAAARAAFAGGALRVYAPSAGPQPLRRDAMDAVATRVSARAPLAGTVPLTAWGVYGGAAMQDRASTLVTDGSGRVHGLPWLRVADGALAAASPGPHPALALMAVAEHVADGVRAECDAATGGAVA